MNVEIKEKTKHNNNNNKINDMSDSNIKNEKISKNEDISKDNTNDTQTKDVGTDTTMYDSKIYKIIGDNSIRKEGNCFYKFCMIINLMIISTTLLILIYYLYSLTDKIENMDFNTIIEGLGSVNENLYNINVLGGRITPLIDQFQNSDIDEISVKKINMLTEQLYLANFKNFNIRRVDLLIEMLNETLYNFNNAIVRFSSPNFNANFDTNFEPKFDTDFDERFNNNNIETGTGTPDTNPTLHLKK